MSKYQAYPEYKDSGVEWLGEIPEHWEVSKVKHLTSFQVGWTPSTRDESNFIGDNLWVNISDLKEKVINSTQKKISDKAALESSMSITPKGSLMYSFKLSVGAVSFAGCDMYTNEAIASFLEESKLPLSYLYYALPFFIIENASTNIYGANILNQELIRSADLIEISFIEAEKIADFLDHEIEKIQLLIKKQQQLVEFLKEKRQALISSAVTKGLELNVEMKDTNINWLGKLPEHWRVNKLRNLFTLGTGLSITRANLTDEGVPCVSYGEVHSRYGFELDPEKDSLQCVDEKYLQTAPRALLNKGDFIFADTSEDLKGSGNFTHLVSDEKVFAGYHTIIVRPLDNAVSRFYAYLFESDVFRSQIQLAVKGVKVYSITQAILKNATVWLPPKEEKLEIANYLDEQTAKIDTLIQKAESAITLMQERRTALISAAVTGKIDVRNWQAPVTSEVTE